MKGAAGQPVSHKDVIVNDLPFLKVHHEFPTFSAAGKPTAPSLYIEVHMPDLLRDNFAQPP